ncbi:hypothetical protein Dvar_83880 [Desulfosarcina variabilis str. Montpellier]
MAIGASSAFKEGKLKMADIQLANLVDMDSPQAVLDEAIKIIGLFPQKTKPQRIRSAFTQTVSLYNGRWKDVSRCNTDYHNLKHVTDCFLAMVRLLHGAAVSGIRFSFYQICQGLVSALLHDVGYLQHKEDTLGTGAKFTTSHVRRGMDFVQRHFAAFGLEQADVHACMTMIHCTDLGADLSAIPFPDQATQRLGKMLATADILAQMADRTYLEKLLLLYFELDEACVDDYVDELDLLRRAEDFYLQMTDRFELRLDAFNRLMIHHFQARWDIDQDLYQRSIRKQQKYLQAILQQDSDDPRCWLRRSRIVEMVRSRYN